MSLSINEKKVYPLGFIGCGAIAGAMIAGICKDGMLKPEDILASDADEQLLKRREIEFGIHTTGDNSIVAARSRVLVMAVKPQNYPAVLSEIAAFLTQDTLLVIIAPGYSISEISRRLDRPAKIIRAMPNTPALVGAGMTGICRNDNVDEEEFAYVCDLFRCFGKAGIVTDAHIEAVVAVSASSPAYVYLLIEAMADGGVAEGLSRNSAMEFAAQAVMGAAKMVLETGIHPAALKDMVCSPAGTTIESIRILEQRGFRSAIMEAIKANVEKSRSML
jgi:pyrroline-5-carboxylate reductase